MRFWDSSALVPLLVAQERSQAMERRLREDHEVIVWWATPVECASALARIERDGGMTAEATNVALHRLRRLSESFHEAQPTERLRSTAQRLLRTHRVRAADSLQLAAAIESSAGRPADLPLVCLDDRLAEAARREGFDVLVGDG